MPSMGSLLVAANSTRWPRSMAWRTIPSFARRDRGVGVHVDGGVEDGPPWLVGVLGEVGSTAGQADAQRRLATDDHASPLWFRVGPRDELADSIRKNLMSVTK